MSPSARGPSGRPDRPPSRVTARERSDRGSLALGDLDIAFVASFPDPAAPLDPPLPEIAFVGRSNVGKSSLLNALVGRRRLARVSATPGKTQLLNVYRAPGFYLVDLPGYGWAKASRSERAGFRRLIEGCLTRRDRLAGVVWLLDIRHQPSEDDYAVQDLLIQTGTPCITVLTKGDKFARGKRLEAAKARARDLGLPAGDPLVTSSITGEGIPDLGDSILAAVRPA